MSLEQDNIKIEVLRYRKEGFSCEAIANIVDGCSRSAIDRFLRKETYTEWWDEHDKKPIADGQLLDHHANIKRLKGNRFIVTSAQNSTYVHEKFLRSLETASNYYDARILVGTFSYNKNGFQSIEKGGGEEDWFDPKLTDYILDEPAELASGLIWCGELNILPTAVNPLSGLHNYSTRNSAIFPHAKIQLESIPTHFEEEAKLLYTTGAVTKRNYIQKKSGQKASFYHSFGALLVEVDDEGDWFVRQLNADSETGEFYDLDKYFTPEGVYDVDQIEAVTWGDLHSEKMDDDVAHGSFIGPGNLLDTLKPKYQFLHDILDFEARNHHSINNPYFRFKSYLTGKDSVRGNIDKVRDVLYAIYRDYTLPVVIESNHDLALERWLREADYKTDPANAITFLELQLQMYKSIEAGDEDFSILEWAVKNLGDLDFENFPWLNKTIFLKEYESFKICDEDGNGIQCGMHGHVGSNGARGSINNFAKQGIRFNIGHSHTAGIRDGVYMAGVSGKLNMGYNRSGSSSWSHSHILTYPNGKRTIVTMRGAKWRAIM